MNGFLKRLSRYTVKPFLRICYLFLLIQILGCEKEGTRCHYTHLSLPGLLYSENSLWFIQTQYDKFTLTSQQAPNTHFAQYVIANTRILVKGSCSPHHLDTYESTGIIPYHPSQKQVVQRWLNSNVTSHTASDLAKECDSNEFSAYFTSQQEKPNPSDPTRYVLVCSDDGKDRLAMAIPLGE